MRGGQRRAVHRADPGSGRRPFRPVRGREDPRSLLRAERAADAGRGAEGLANRAVLHGPGLPPAGEGRHAAPGGRGHLLHHRDQRRGGRPHRQPLPPLGLRREALPQARRQPHRGRLQERRERIERARENLRPPVPDFERAVGEGDRADPQAAVPRRLGLGARADGDGLLRPRHAHRGGRRAHRLRVLRPGFHGGPVALHGDGPCRGDGPGGRFDDVRGPARRPCPGEIRFARGGREPPRPRDRRAEPETLVAERRGRAAPLPAGGEGGWRDVDAQNRPPHDRGAEHAGQGRERQGGRAHGLPRERRGDLLQGRELDSVRRLREPPDAGALPRSARLRAAGEHEHGAPLGRRAVRA